MKFVALFAFALLLGTSLPAQNPDTKRNWHWYFSVNAGLDFSSGTPVADTLGQIEFAAGSSTMSDADGDLLFYTDGRAMWDRIHDTMPNGTDLGVGQLASPRDGTVIIPKPGNDSIYYLFTVDGWQHQYLNGLRYHVVDMAANGGLGDVIEKNVQLFPAVSEELAATRHANGCDYWVIAHDRNSADFLAYRVTASGVDTMPVISTIGYDYSQTHLIDQFAQGWSLRFDPYGRLLAQEFDWVYENTGLPYEIRLCQFDNDQGILMDSFVLPSDTGLCGIGFSPNGNIFYAETGYYQARLYQYDVTNYDSSAIVFSRQFIYTPYSNVCIGFDLKCGPDGRMYGVDETAFPFYGIDSLPVINHPNVWGPGCDVQHFGVGLGGRGVAQSLPNFVADFAGSTAPEHCPEALMEASSTNAIHFTWNEEGSLIISSEVLNGEDALVRVFSAEGRLVRQAALHFEGIEELVSMPHLSEGIYLITVNTRGDGVINQKIVIAH